jgi:hypothetical protein
MSCVVCNKNIQENDDKFVSATCSHEMHTSCNTYATKDQEKTGGCCICNMKLNMILNVAVGIYHLNGGDDVKNAAVEICINQMIRVGICKFNEDYLDLHLILPEDHYRSLIDQFVDNNQPLDPKAIPEAEYQKQMSQITQDITDGMVKRRNQQSFHNEWSLFTTV